MNDWRSQFAFECGFVLFKCCSYEWKLLSGEIINLLFLDWINWSSLYIVWTSYTINIYNKLWGFAPKYFVLQIYCVVYVAEKEWKLQAWLIHKRTGNEHVFSIYHNNCRVHSEVPCVIKRYLLQRNERAIMNNNDWCISRRDDPCAIQAKTNSNTKGVCEHDLILLSVLLLTTVLLTPYCFRTAEEAHIHLGSSLMEGKVTSKK